MTRCKLRPRHMIFRALAMPLLATAVSAQEGVTPPDLRTPPPVIHLADNLDEKDGLCWCIDTLGRGFSEDLQVHSCKPQGGDVQFSFLAETGSIRSVAYPGYCVTLRMQAEPTRFGLADCNADDPAQGFAYDAESGALNPVDAPDLCLAAGEVSRTAGPFMSRDLVLADCSETDPALWRWVVRE